MAARKRLSHDEKTKDQIRGSQLVNLLAQYAQKGTFNGAKIDGNRIAAARAALPFLRPALQSVEQTNINPLDDMSQEQLLERARALITSHPELIAQLNLMPKPVQVADLGTESPQETALTIAK